MTLSISLIVGVSSSQAKKSYSTKSNYSLIEDIRINTSPQQIKEIDNEKIQNAILYDSKSYLDLLDSTFCEDAICSEYDI